jgi:hypothetical protein
MDPDKSTEKPAVKPGAGTDAPRKKPYAPPRLTTYGHISKLTTGSSGTRNEPGGMRRSCL